MEHRMLQQLTCKPQTCNQQTFTCSLHTAEHRGPAAGRRDGPSAPPAAGQRRQVLHSGSTKACQHCVTQTKLALSLCPAFCLSVVCGEPAPIRFALLLPACSIQQSAALALGRLANYSDDLAEAVVQNEILPQLVSGPGWHTTQRDVPQEERCTGQKKKRDAHRMDSSPVQETCAWLMLSHSASVLSLCCAVSCCRCTPWHNKTASTRRPQDIACVLWPSESLWPAQAVLRTAERLAQP